MRKSTLARLVAKEYATAGWRVKIADLDIAQGTSFNWQARRLQHALEPTIPVERFGTVEQVLKVAALYDLIIFDCPPNATAGTLKAAQASTCIILPTGLSLDDLEPSILLAHEFIKQGLLPERLAFALCRVGDSEIEIAELVTIFSEQATQCSREPFQRKLPIAGPVTKSDAHRDTLSFAE